MFFLKIRQGLKNHPQEAMLTLVLGLAGLAAGWWASQIILDDAMITFRVAENLAYGRGFVYNPGERVQVTTTPLYAIILAAGTWLFGAAPRAALALNILLATLIPILTYNVGRRLAGPITGIGGALLITLMPLLVIAFSMESYLYVALILASMEAYAARRDRLAGLLVGITALVRGDAVLMGVSMLSFDVLRHRRLRWPLIIPAVTIPAAWYLFATLYYGWPFPATLAAKTAQGEFNWLGQYFLSGLGEYWEDWIELYSRLFYLFPLLIGLGLVRAIFTERLWWVLIGRDVLYVATFVGLGVTFAEWYYAPLAPGLALLSARGVQWIAAGVTGLVGRVTSQKEKLATLTGGAAAAAIFATLLVTMYPVTADIVRSNPDWKAQVYPDAGRWIAQNTNASANLATIDIGHLGYWSGRHIVDIVGLAQPDVAPHIGRGDFGYAIRRYRPDMVLIGASWLTEVQSKDWFQAGYIPRHALKFAGLNEPLILFTRPTGVKVHSRHIPAAEIEPLHVDFNRQITLTGYHLPPSALPGSILELTLFWQVDTQIKTDFTVFVQLVDKDNNIIAQGDSKPQRGFYPTPHWQPGEQIVDTYPLRLPPDTPPGSYNILLGFYNAADGARLQILDQAGQFKSDHVRLPGVQVKAP